MGDLDELFVNKETFDVYHCPHCGKVEFFVDGIGENLRPSKPPGEVRPPSTLRSTPSRISPTFQSTSAMTLSKAHSERIAELSYMSKFALICAIGAGTIGLVFAVWRGFNGGSVASSLSAFPTSAVLLLIGYNQCRAEIQRLQSAPPPAAAESNQAAHG